MKTKIVIVFIAMLALFFACRKSSLSDVEITDPGILKVYATVGNYSNLDSTASEVDMIHLRILDKTDHSVELKKGRVLCNDQELSLGRDLVGPIYYLPEEEAEIVADSLYTFIVELADGQQYTSSITISDPFMNTFTAPDSWTCSQTDSLVLSWNSVHNDYDTRIDWSFILKDGVSAPTGMQTGGSISVNDQNYYAFPASAFTDTNDENIVKQLYISIGSEMEGEYDARYYRGGTYGRFEFRKYIQIN